MLRVCVCVVSQRSAGYIHTAEATAAAAAAAGRFAAAPSSVPRPLPSVHCATDSIIAVAAPLSFPLFFLYVRYDLL